MKRDNSSPASGQWLKKESLDLLTVRGGIADQLAGKILLANMLADDRRDACADVGEFQQRSDLRAQCVQHASFRCPPNLYFGRSA
jgi:hypothetical protein